MLRWKTICLSLLILEPLTIKTFTSVCRSTVRPSVRPLVVMSSHSFSEKGSKKLETTSFEVDSEKNGNIFIKRRLSRCVQQTRVKHHSESFRVLQNVSYRHCTMCPRFIVIILIFRHPVHHFLAIPLTNKPHNV